jgi:hypothetical protein
LLKTVKAIVLIFLLGILTVAIYSIPKSAESVRWSTADGYDCETTGPLRYTCCMNITVVIGGVTLSANRCVDCEENMEGIVSCGDPYHVAVNSVNTGGVVDPKIKNYAKDLIGQGLTALNQGSQEVQVDPKIKNYAKDLIGQSLTLLTKGGAKGGTVDPKVTKDAGLLIDRILSADKMIIEDAQNIKVPKSGDNDTKVPSDFLNKGGLLTKDNQITTNKESSPTPPPCPDTGPIPPYCTMKPLLK